MNYNSAIASVLKELGVRELLTGYDYIETAVRLRVTNTIQKRDGAMQLYYAVARKHNTTYKAVERDIRYAIECAFDYADPEVLNRWFGNTLSERTGKATNRQFIESVVKAIEQENDNEAE